jgi:hypothetical protein
MARRDRVWTCCGLTVSWLAAGLLGWAAETEPAAVLAVASCEPLGPTELRLSVTFYNAGAELAVDYTPFIHFDRRETGESLYTEPAPGPRALVGTALTPAWGASEATTVTFPAVTLTPSLRQTIFVKAGLYDARGTRGRLSLVGADASQRVPVGRLVRTGESWRFERGPPSDPRGAGPRVGVQPRALVREPPDPPVVRWGEVDPGAWRIECRHDAVVTAARTREQLCWSESALKLSYSGVGAESGFALRPPQPISVPAGAAVAYPWLFGNTIGGRAYGRRSAPAGLS